MKIRSVILASVALLALQTEALHAKQLWAKSFLGQPAPALEVEQWLTPRPEMKGKFVLIDFWAHWCPPCREAIAELNAIQAMFGDKIAVVGLTDETAATVTAFQDSAKANNPEWVINYAIAIDTQKRMESQVEVTGIPHVLIIDPKGIVRWEGFPFLKGYELTPSVVRSILAAYGGRPSS